MAWSIVALLHAAWCATSNGEQHARCFCQALLWSVLWVGLRVVSFLRSCLQAGQFVMKCLSYARAKLCNLHPFQWWRCQWLVGPAQDRMAKGAAAEIWRDLCHCYHCSGRHMHQTPHNHLPKQGCLAPGNARACTLPSTLSLNCTQPAGSGAWWQSLMTTMAAVPA